MGERALRNKVEKLLAIEAQQKDLEKQAEKLMAEIKADMEDKGKDELRVGDHQLRLKTIFSERFDTRAFKEAHGDLFEAYRRLSVTKRFTIA